MVQEPSRALFLVACDSAASARCLPVAGTSCEWSNETGLHRAVPRTPARVSNPENAPHEGTQVRWTVRFLKALVSNAAAFSGKMGRQEKDPRDVLSAGTRSRAEPTVLGMLASFLLRDEVDPERS